MIGQQIGILNYKVVRHCQQLSDERTTARQHEDGIVEYTKRRVNGVLVCTQRAAHDNVNCLEIVRRRELSKHPTVLEDEPSDPMLYFVEVIVLDQLCRMQHMGIDGIARCVLADQCVCLTIRHCLDGKAAEKITCPQQ